MQISRFFFMFVLFFTWLPIISGAFGVSQTAVQTNKGKTLTIYLRELNAKYGERISFSPTLTDKVSPRVQLVEGTLEEILTKLLLETNLGFRSVNGNYYLHIKPEKKPVVLTKALPKEELKEEIIILPLIAVNAQPISVILPVITPVIPKISFPAPIIPPAIAPKQPRFAIKTNLLYDATATINLGFEFAVAKKWTIDLSANYNPWTFSGNRKWKHLLIQPEVRFWSCERFNGHFVGAHLHGGIFNIGALPKLGGIVSENMQKNRYQGKFYGAGFSYGYHLILSGRWSLESSIGLGYARILYDKYQCKNCGEKIKDGAKNYFGPTKLSISLIYNIK